MAKPTTIWQVTYEECTQWSANRWSEADEPLWVLARSAKCAFEAVKKHRVGQTWSWKDVNGKEHIVRVVRVRPIEIERLGKIDLFS